MSSSNVCFKTGQNKSIQHKKFPKCTDILLQTVFFWFFLPNSHHQMVNIVHIV